MAKMIKRVMKSAGIRNFTGHDLRRTFTTVVRSTSGDEFLAMRLIRDKIPGVGERYIQFPKEELVRALEKYSHLRRLGPDSGEPAETGESSPPRLEAITPPLPRVRGTKKLRKLKVSLSLMFQTTQLAVLCLRT